jgi:hypothetical protein
MLERIVTKTNFKDVIIIIIVSFAIIGFWRGTWQLLDKFFLPNNFILSQIIPLVLGLIILFLISFIKLKTNKEKK